MLMQVMRMVGVAIFMAAMAGLAAGEPILEDVPHGRPDRPIPAVEPSQPYGPAPRQGDGGSFKGEWSLIHHGFPYQLVLKQELEIVTGTFDLADGPVSGTIEDDTLFLTWKQDGKDCHAMLEMAWDEDHNNQVYLTGQWEGPSESGSWTFVGPTPARR